MIVRVCQWHSNTLVLKYLDGDNPIVMVLKNAAAKIKKAGIIALPWIVVSRKGSLKMILMVIFSFVQWRGSHPF